MDELDQVRQRVRDAAIGELPEPWKKLAMADVAGVTDVGFAEDSEFLLVLSGHGREIFDCRSGKRVARDTGMEHRSSWYGRHDLIAKGFGPLANKEVRLAGASGGGLPYFTRDGWGAVRLPIDWPAEHLLLTAPYTSIFQPTAEFWKVATVREPVAWGFSYTGNALIAATVEGISIFGREG